MIDFFIRSQWVHFVGLPLAILVATFVLEALARHWAKKSKEETAKK